jgi:hypothetical protein
MTPPEFYYATLYVTLTSLVASAAVADDKSVAKPWKATSTDTTSSKL